MRRFLLLVITLGLLSSNIFTQKVMHANQPQSELKVTENSEPIPLAGSHYLIERNKEIEKYLELNPEKRYFTKPRSTAWGFNVGDPYTWWAASFQDGVDDYEVPATVKAVGDNCYIFVSDDSWAKGEVDQDAVDAIVEAFDNSTPAYANKGIYDVDVEAYGEPPNVDSDTKIIIFILDIDDGYDGTGGYIAGYFSSANELPTTTIPTSNEAEIFYMDSNPANLLTDSGRLSILTTTAHEFQHMIHYNYDTNEISFINEGCSEIAEHLCGYGVRGSAGYAGNTNVYLFGWDEEGNVLNDYSRAALWTLYLYEQMPTGFLKTLVQNTTIGYNGLNSSFISIGSDRKYNTVFADWLIANYLQDNSIDSKYGYTYSPISKPAGEIHHITTASGGGTIKKMAAEYITFANGTPFKITFSGHSTIDLKAIKIGPSGTVIEKVSRGVEYDVPDFGTTYTEVTFVVYRDSEFDTGEQSYTYSSIGSGGGPLTIELSYEDGEPDGYAPSGTWAHPSDSVAVKFDGISGGVIDSLRFAFRRAGTIQMEINEYDGTTFLRSLNLYGPTQINSPDSTSIPYPVPYDNWVTVDLSNENIDASKDFFVSLLLGNNTSEPGIMVSAENSGGHSFWYDSTEDRWIAYTAEGGKIWNYFIRAYVTINKSAGITAPTNLVANAGQGWVKLNWNASGGPIEGYNIYRGSASGFSPESSSKILPTVSDTETTFINTLPDIEANTPYYYIVSSYDAEANEEFSVESTTTTLSINNKNGLPSHYSLGANYPNPFNPSTTFNFATPKDGLVKFTVHDLLGRVIYSESRNLVVGNYSFTWEGQNDLNQKIVSGVYFLRMETDGFNQTRKMLMMK